MARDFIIPAHIVSGEEALSKASSHMKEFGKKALIVTDPMMVTLGNVKKVEEQLTSEGITYVIYDGITGEPSDIMIEKGAEMYQDTHCDFLLAIGGGSPIDSMKAIAVVVSTKKDITTFMGSIIQSKLAPMVAIPTTAGTGSEATQFTIITNTKENIKMLLKGPVLMPSLAIIDPQFTLSAPRNITASTGLDALCHAVESYTSRLAQPLSKSFSISAIKKILQFLPIAYQDGQHMEAREYMAIASLEAGIAFNNSSVTIIHGMSRPIGALFHVPHGLSNAMLLKACFSFVLDGAYDCFGTLAKECGVADGNDSMEVASKKLLQEMSALVDSCGVATLAEFGVDKEEFFASIPKMAKDAMDSGSPQNTWKTVTIEDMEAIYKSLWNV